MALRARAQTSANIPTMKTPTEEVVFYRVSWKFFWCGYIYKSKDVKTLDEVRDVIQELRKNSGGFVNKKIRVETFIQSL